MSKREKLLERLRSRPKDFTWDELVLVMKDYGCTLEKGRGSRRCFVHKASGKKAHFHEPHPGRIVLDYVIRDALNFIDELEDDDADDDVQGH